jgi:serine/threonine protein kinase
MDELVGTSLGQYEIKKKIGQGGMAHVFKAYQPSLDRFVAVKVLSPVLAEQPGFTERFQREAHSVARLLHPNILQVYDFGVQNKLNYIVMRYVENSQTLRDRIGQGGPVDELLDYITQVADALNYAHKRGIIHRDIKPSNILIDEQWALLSDFGLVKMIGTDSYLTGTGVVTGTPAYMSPEQATGSHVDQRTDIYALGIVLHEILTGKIPHDAPTPLAIIVKRSSEPITPPCQIKPDIPKSLEHVVLRSLQTNPEARYSSTTEFAEALTRAQADPNYREDLVLAPVEAATIASSQAVPPLPDRRRPGIIIGGLVAALVTVVAVIAFLVLRATGNDELATQTTSPIETSVSSEVLVAGPPTGTPTPGPSTSTFAAIPTATVSRTPLARARTRLEVWSGPGAEYDLLGYLPEGATAEIISQDESGQWWQIKASLTRSGVAWIMADPESAEAINVAFVPIMCAVLPPKPAQASSTDSPGCGLSSKATSWAASS